MRAWPMDTPFNVADLSMQPPASFPELYQELWWYSGATAYTGTAQQFLQKGNTATTTTNTSSANKLFTLSSSWNPSLKYALEVSISSTSPYTTTVILWDLTSTATQVSGSTITTTSTTTTIVRSGQFTLTPGHSYGISIQNSGSNAYITDASLIIFPPAGSVSPSLSSISLANPSGGSLKEAYYGLWVYSSGAANFVNYTSATSSLAKGTTTSYAIGGVNTYLFTLNSAWKSTQKFAFETSLYSSSSSATAYAALIDLDSGGTVVSGSQINTSSTSATLVRSGSFTLVPSHRYGVSAWSSGAYTTSITKAHLIALAN